MAKFYRTDELYEKLFGDVPWPSNEQVAEKIKTTISDELKEHEQADYKRMMYQQFWIDEDGNEHPIDYEHPLISRETKFIKVTVEDKKDKTTQQIKTHRKILYLPDKSRFIQIQWALQKSLQQEFFRKIKRKDLPNDWKKFQRHERCGGPVWSPTLDRDPFSNPTDRLDFDLSNEPADRFVAVYDEVNFYTKESEKNNPDAVKECEYLTDYFDAETKQWNRGKKIKEYEFEKVFRSRSTVSIRFYSGRGTLNSTRCVTKRGVQHMRIKPAAEISQEDLDEGYGEDLEDAANQLTGEESTKKDPVDAGYGTDEGF